MKELVRLQWRDRRFVMVGWLAGWTVLVGMYVATWPTVRSHARQYDDILAGLPKAMRAAIGASGTGAFSTPGGYLTAELLGVTGPIVAVTMGVLLGVACFAREEEDGTIELVLAQPVRRSHLLMSRAVAGAAEVVGILLVVSLLLWALGQTVDLSIGLAACVRAFTMLALLSCEGMAVSVLAGALLGRASRARAVAGALGLLAFLLAALGPSIAGLEGAVSASPFHTLVQSDPFRHSPTLGPIAALLVPSVVMIVLAVAAFRRRDLRLR